MRDNQSHASDAVNAADQEQLAPVTSVVRTELRRAPVSAIGQLPKHVHDEAAEVPDLDQIR